MTGPDPFSYVANDGTLDSAAATVSLNVHLNIAPVVTAFDQSAVRGQVFNASDLFSALTATATPCCTSSRTTMRTP